MPYFPDIAHPRRTIGARKFDFARQVAVMAIINRTPDSFHDNGATFGLDEAVAAVRRAVDEGADWVDVGGVPFSPDTGLPGVRAEIDRVVPVIEAARARTDVVISVDTFRADVAREALASGADVVNDTAGLRDPRLAGVVAEAGAHLIVTHSLAEPRKPYPKPRYRDVVAEVKSFLRDRVRTALRAGIPPEKIIIDPGPDLNKNTHHSLELCRRFSEIAALGYPVLAALSNKDFIGETLGCGQHDRMEGTIAANVMCVLRGARILRVHDVRAAVATVRMTEAMLGWRGPVNVRHNT